MEPTRFCKGYFNAHFNTGFSFDQQNKATYKRILKLPPEDIVEILSSYIDLKSLSDLNTLTERVNKFS